MGTKFFYVTRDGVRKSPLSLDENDSMRFLMRAQGMSTDWAIRYEGWKYEEGELQAAIAYGTDEVAKQLNIEAVRIDAAFERKRRNDQMQRGLATGANAEDVAATVEHDQN